MLKKGEKVVMHTCGEAEQYDGKIWTCKTDEYEKGESVYKQRLVFLEGFSGCFAVEFLQKVNQEENKPEYISEWHEDDGDCLWWFFPIEQPPYCGTPLDCDFPDYVTHFTRFSIPDLK